MSKMQTFIEKCLVDAARVVEKAREKGLKIKMKGRRDWATSADLAAESLIVGRVKKEFPDALVLSEESYAQDKLEADSLFVIDPIDGTHNFIRGIPLYGISIAHFSKGKPTAGGVYFVGQKMLFYAERGKQSTMNGKKIHVSDTAKVEDFFFLSDSRLHLAKEMGYLKALLYLEDVSQHTRFLGSAVYEMCYVACGMADAEFDYKLKPYDFAAAAFIVEQAGGKVTDFDGNPWSLRTTKFLCSNGKQHKKILEVLNGKF
jgi:myo-inositol-1(or 4)-monophosphatase